MINYDEIGKGFVDLLDEEEKAVLRIGMIPLKKYELLKEELFKTLCRKLSEDKTSFLFGLDPNKLVKCLKKDFIREVEHKLSVAILNHGNLVV
jgi:hypothetical protein